MAVGGAFVAGSIVSKLIMDTTQWSASVTAVTTKTARMGKSLTKVGGMLTKGLTLPLALAGAAAVKASADFEQKLVNAFSVTGSASEAVKQQMSDLAREMGATTVFAATEAADAMYYMASAGWKADDMAAALKDTLDLAAATQSDLAMATEAVISTINQFGLTSADAGRVSNVFASAISNSQATMDRLKTSMKYVGPVMNSLGKSVEETSSILMGLYNAGIDASTAGTALRMGLVKLMVPTNRSREALANLGLTFEQVNPETHKLADIIQLLGERGASTKDIMMLFGQRAGPAFAALIAKGGDALKDYEAQITGTNRAAEMAEMQIDTFKGSFKLLTSALTEAAITIGDALAPVIRKIGEGFRSLVAAFNELGPQAKSFIGIIVGIAAAMGPLALIIGKILVLVSKLKVALVASKAAFLISAAGAGILLGALAALVIGIMKVKKAQDEANAAAQRAADQEDILFNKLKKATDAAGMSELQFLRLRDAYRGSAGAMAMAIKKGKEGKELQEALAKVSAEHREEIEKQKTAMDDGIPTVAELTAEFNRLAGTEDEAKKAAEEWTEFMSSIGITTIQAKADRVKDLEGKLEKLHKLYKSGAIDMKSYVDGVNKVKKEITKLSTTLTTTALPAATFTADQIATGFGDATGKMGQHIGDFTVKVKEEAQNVIDIGAIMSSTFAGSFNESLVGILEGTMSWKDAIGNIFKNMKSAAIQVFADIATSFITDTVKSIVTGTAKMAGNIAGSMTTIGSSITGVGAGLGQLITSLAKGIATAAEIIAASAPAILIAAGVALAIYAGFKLIASLFKKTAKPGSELDFLRKITEATTSTRDMLRADYKEEFHIMQNSLVESQKHLFAIQARADRRNQLLTEIGGYEKLTAEATEEMANQLKNLKSAQGGGIFKQTELAVMHGTSAMPEIAMPIPMFEKFTAARGQSNVSMRTDMNFHIDVRDQIDPHSAQRITRETIVPQVLDAIEINDRQVRTRLEEVLKLRL